MRTARAPTIGREHELGRIAQFVAAIPDCPASLVLDGVAGIGKTAIWSEGVAAARTGGVRVLDCRCGESDAGWAFAGLGDLLDSVGNDITSQLPEVQQRALSAALLLSDVPAGAPGDRVVAVAVLGVLRALARAGPVLIAIDDVQWLDPSTHRALSFAVRRLSDEHVRLLTSRRVGPLASPTDLSDLGIAGERLWIGPVSVGTLQRIVEDRLEMTLSRPTLTRLHQATGGNPLVTLEMARALQRRGREPAPDEPLPVPADLRVLVTERLRGLSADARTLLLVTAALAHPTVDSVSAATGSPDGSIDGLGEVIAAGILELDGDRMRFTHPLIASIPYADLTPAARRHLHSRLAATVQDPEERARHAALAVAGADVAVAEALETAATHARARGSVDAAAELATLAIRRTPAADTTDLMRRTVFGAEQLFRLGESTRAKALLQEKVAATAPGVDRVRALLLLAMIASWEGGDEPVARLCEQATDEAGNDPLSLARCHAAFADTAPCGPAVDLVHAETAVRLLEAAAAPADLVSSALTNVAMHRLRLGRGLAIATLERAISLEDREHLAPITDRPGMGLGIGLKVVDRFDDSRRWLNAMRSSAIDEGDDSALPLIFGHLALVECWSGENTVALDYAVEGRQIADRLGFPAPFLASSHVLVLAHLGLLTAARTRGEQDLAAHLPLDLPSAIALDSRSLGFVEAFAGNNAAAAEHFRRALEITDHMGLGEPAIMRLHPDAVATLVLLGRAHDAMRLVDELDQSARDHGLPWASAMALRCHALVHASDGNVVGALSALEEAMTHHARLPMPFETARTQLLYGTVLRRAGHRNDARAALDNAHATFVRLRTPVQAALAVSALGSLGGRPTALPQLTAVEARVATVVADGLTNREAADALFISVRTVESHLASIYRKLGIRSRSELAGLRQQLAAGTPPS